MEGMGLKFTPVMVMLGDVLGDSVIDSKNCLVVFTICKDKLDSYQYILINSNISQYVQMCVIVHGSAYTHR